MPDSGPVIDLRAARQLVALTGGLDRLLSVLVDELDRAALDAATRRKPDVDMASTEAIARELEGAAWLHREGLFHSSALWFGRACGVTKGGWHDVDFAWELMEPLEILASVLLHEDDDDRIVLDPWIAVNRIVAAARAWARRPHARRAGPVGGAT